MVSEIHFTSEFRYDKISAAETLYKRAVICGAHELSNAAIALLNTSIQLNPNFTDAYFLRAEMERKIGKIWEANQDFSTVVKILEREGIDPYGQFYTEILSQQFELHLNHGQICDALPYILKATHYSIEHNNVNRALIHKQTAKAYEKLECPQEALFELEKAGKLSSDPEINLIRNRILQAAAASESASSTPEPFDPNLFFA